MPPAIEGMVPALAPGAGQNDDDAHAETRRDARALRIAI
jgi:hypothetical protein